MQLFRNAHLATLHDTTDEPEGIADAVQTVLAGNLSIVTESGDTVTFTAIPVGTIVPIRTRRVRSTGSTAGIALMLYGPRT